MADEVFDALSLLVHFRGINWWQSYLSYELEKEEGGLIIGSNNRFPGTIAHIARRVYKREGLWQNITTYIILTFFSP